MRTLTAFLSSGKLPGLAAQTTMSPTGRMDDSYEPDPAHARRSAVLIVLYSGDVEAGRQAQAQHRKGAQARHGQGAGIPGREKAWLNESRAAVDVFFPAIVRATDGSPHSGQIGLPGGAAEEGEVFPVETALREAYEEIGLDAGSVAVLGTLTPLYIPVSNYSVTPVVAASRDRTRPAMARDAQEVEEIIDLSANSLSNTRSEDMFDTPLGRIAAPCYRALDSAGVERCVWGATAMMLAEFLICHEAALSEV